jgi:PQQ-dependent dehydrogenase (methanol/ethanol family)
MQAFDSRLNAAGGSSQTARAVSVLARALVPMSVVVGLALACSTVRGQGAMKIDDAPAAQPAMPPVFTSNCSLCHGDDALGTDRGPNLVREEDLGRMSDAGIADIIRKGRRGMPAFSALPPEQIDTLTRYLRELNPVNGPTSAAPPPAVAAPAEASRASANPPSSSAASAGATPVSATQVSAGEAIFFGNGQCAACHSVRGRGGVNGPDLSDIGKKLSAADLTAALVDPSARIAPGYGMVTVKLKDGKTARGFARAQRTHDLVLQTGAGKLRSFIDSEYMSVTADKQSAMPAFRGNAQEQKALLAYLSQLKGAGVGPLQQPQKPVTKAEIERISHPLPGEWPTYNGKLDGNRYSTLPQIDRKNVPTLRLDWQYTIPFFGLETTPVVVDGVMYVTGNNQVFALDARTGSEIWRYERPKSDRATISSDAAIGVNRGVALLGDRVFYLTDDAHLLALSRLSGALLWDIYAPEATERYGGTAAPLVVDDLVITGVSGADDGIRGFIAAYKATTGELVWRTWSVPKRGEPGSETWQGSALPLGGGSTWMSGSYDTAADVVYWAIGNPYPDTNGDQRLGSNQYTNSDVALDAKTGKMLWHYQFTPHDLHDWDANQPIVLVDTTWRGQPKKLILHANRNGFFYVLDRTTGVPLMATQMVDRMTWATGINPKTWTPDLLPANETSVQGTVTCPAVRGATNWYSTAFNPETRLYYVMTVEDCGTYRKADEGGFGRYNDPAHPAQKILRALDIETGKATWQVVLPGNPQANYSGVLSTAGGLVFFGENDGGFAAADAGTGKMLWHFAGSRTIKSSPMTYSILGKQYVAVASGSEISVFALPD